MKVLVIEDELPARAKLIQMLSVIDESLQVVGQVGSVMESIEWLKTNTFPDVAFVDIQLSDDHSFEIFKQISVTFPIIFTTAYDKYLLESFEHNSIDYLLKPITHEKLSRSIQKVKTLQQHFSQNPIVNLLSGKGSKKIIARKGTEFIALEPSDIAYFYTEHKVVFVKEFNGRRLIIDQTLADLQEALDPDRFFRINRKYLAHVHAIEKYRPDNGKLLVTLRPAIDEEIFVSKETAPIFRKWIGSKQ